MKQIPISFVGSDTYLTLGAGNFNIAMQGTDMSIGAGPGNDTVQMNGVKNSVVTLGAGNSTVVESGIDNIILLQSVKGNTDTVDAGASPRGAILVGGGNTVITDNGKGAYIAVGNGNNTITANGSGDVITAGTGANTILARGDSDLINVAVLGGKSDTIIANGYSDTIVSAGSNTTINAAGGHDHIAVNGGSAVVTASGWADVISVGGNTDGTPAKANVSITTLSKVYVAGHTLGTAISESGVDNVVFLENGGSAAVTLGVGGDTVTVGSNTDGSNGYSGLARIIDLGTNTVDLHNLAGLGTYAQVSAALVHAGGNWKLPTPGGGEVLFVGAKPMAANFSFS